MATYDHGGGCPCGLYAECKPDCVHWKSPLHATRAEWEHLLRWHKDEQYRLAAAEDYSEAEDHKHRAARIAEMLKSHPGAKPHVQAP